MAAIPEVQNPRWLNVGCGPFYADGWLNTDFDSRGDVQPDVLVEFGAPLASFDDNSFDRIYCGHVLEHNDWRDLIDPSTSLVVELHRILAPGGDLMVVGPDCERALRQWQRGDLSWEDLIWMLERDATLDSLGTDDAARHHWNCYEARVAKLLKLHDFSPIPVNIESEILNDWPIVSRVGWQFAMMAKAMR